MKPLLIAFALLSMSIATLIWLRQTAFDATPGQSAAIPVRWPDESSIPRQADVATLLLFAHPRCPCTRATLGELAIALDQSDAPVAVHVLFTRPDASIGEPWQPTDSWRQANQIVGAKVQWDDDGREAARFGARASGHIVLFDSAGNLCFEGGITARRGQEGENGFRNALVDILRGGGEHRRSAPVFGCSLVCPE